MLEDLPGSELVNTMTSTIMLREHVALAYFIMGDNASSRANGERLIGDVNDYLFGSWRDHYTVKRSVRDEATPRGWKQVDLVLGRDGCRRELEWMGQFRAGLLWSFCLNRPDEVLRMADYPSEDCTDESGLECGRGAVDKCYYLVLSDVIRGRPDPLDPIRVGVIERGRRKRPKLLLAALRRILQRDPEGFLAALAACISHHRKEDLPRAGLANKLALDATILYHVGATLGLPVRCSESDARLMLLLDRSSP